MDREEVVGNCRCVAGQTFMKIAGVWLCSASMCVYLFLWRVLSEKDFFFFFLCRKFPFICTGCCHFSPEQVVSVTSVISSFAWDKHKNEISNTAKQGCWFLKLISSFWGSQMPLGSKLLHAAQGPCISLFFHLPFTTIPEFQKMSRGKAAWDWLGCSWCVLSPLAGKQEPGQVRSWFLSGYPNGAWQSRLKQGWPWWKLWLTEQWRGCEFNCQSEMWVKGKVFTLLGFGLRQGNCKLMGKKETKGCLVKVFPISPWITLN